MTAVRPASCPFCKGTVSSDIVQFGGNCPHCLLEIPGEEAPTDPGLVARNKLAAEKAAKEKAARTKNMRYAALFSLFVCAAGVMMFVQAQNEKAARTYEMPDDLFMPPLQEAAAPVAPAAGQPAAGQPASQGPDRPKVKPGLANAGSGLDAGPDVSALPSTAAAGVASASASGPKHASGDAAGADVAIAMNTASNVSLSIDPAPAIVTTSSGPLSDEGEIFSMIKQVMSRYNPQVQACYNSRLKQNPELAGAWKLSFSVAKDGTVRGTTVASAGSNKDAELEACMVKTVSAWKFAPIAYEQPVTKTVRFGSSGY